jgi:hypothetical protein
MRLVQPVIDAHCNWSAGYDRILDPSGNASGLSLAESRSPRSGRAGNICVMLQTELRVTSANAGISTGSLMHGGSGCLLPCG